MRVPKGNSARQRSHGNQEESDPFHQTIMRLVVYGVFAENAGLLLFRRRVAPQCPVLA